MILTAHVPFFFFFISDFLGQSSLNNSNERSICNNDIGLNLQDKKEKRDIYVIFSENFFIKVNGTYTSHDLFVLEEDISVIDRNSLLLKTEDLLRDIRNCETDFDFGQIYAVVGQFTMNSKGGFLVVLSVEVAKQKFDSSNACHCVLFTDDRVKRKIEKRISRYVGIRLYHHQISLDSLTVVTVTSITSGQPIIINPVHKQQPILGNSLRALWDRLFCSEIDFLITTNRVDLKNIKKRTLMKVERKTLRTKLSKSVEDTKIYHSMSRGYVIGDCKENLKAFNLSEKINLREETISLGEGMFSIKWCPKKFTEGFCKFEKICKGGSQVVSAVTASIFMDPSFRIIDCESFEDNVVGTTSIDLDQLIIKFNLHIIESENLSEDQLLLNWYNLLAPLFTATNNATTNFSPTSMRSSCNQGGSSLDKSVESKKYITLCHG